MRKSKLFVNLIGILMLVFTTLGNTSLVAQAGNNNNELKADPRLLQMAKENPDATFMVVVQREVRNQDVQEDAPEADVAKEGGRVKKQFSMVESFSAEITGKQIIKLAKKRKVRWISADAPMVSTAAPGMESLRDEFKSKSYNGNDGTRAWSVDWTEGDQAGDASVSTADTGVFKVGQAGRCSGGTGYCLQIDPDILNGYVYRQADLSGAVSVWLSFYRNNYLNASRGTSEEVKLEISSNGGTNWTALQTYSSRAKTGAGVDSFDISAYASSNMQIRFRVSQRQSGTRYIYIDDIEIAFVRPSAFLSSIKADQVSLDGNGVTVVVVDSGISTKNDDFKSGGSSRIIANQSFGNQNNNKDEYGHGTHVAGIIGGNGAASNGLYRGVAPGVDLISLKVSDKDGMTYESSLISSLQWVYDNKDIYNIRVVNISLNSTVAQSYHTSPLDAAVEILWLNGIVVVVSAGNNGTVDGPSIIYPPANDPFVITVGATEDKGTGDLADDNLAVFSAYGTTDDGFAKPDLVAPGRNVVAPLSDKAATVYGAHPLHRVGDYYFRMSGTSMSAPVVSGAVALLLQNDPGLTPDQVKYRLMATTNQSWNFDATQSGAGYLDVYAAVNGTTTESANIDITPSLMLSTGTDPITWGTVGWNSVGWNSVGWNSVGWNSVGWNAATWDD